MKSAKKINCDSSALIYGYYYRMSPFMSLLLIIKIISGGGAVALVIGAGFLKIENGIPLYSFLILVVGFFIFITFWSIRNAQSSYEIFEDRLDFFSVYKPTERVSIKMDEIVQARYEDDFNHFIYLYLCDNYTSIPKKIKENRIPIPVESLDFTNNVITILKFFQDQKKKVYISTRKKEINQALNLKNWTDPPYPTNKIVDALLRSINGGH